MGICFLNPTPLRPPFVPLFPVNSLWIYLFIPGSRNPCNRTRERLPLLEAREEVMTEKCSTGKDSDKVFSKMGEN
jgi:hypothetical protein